ncbi:MAG TPA: AAA family ATPase [Thermoanaerobaculia bacterium]|nr:AAA family ATPase [Thermoanaerobaculia bacterium]
MEIESIKTKRGEEIPIGKLTVLVGANNVGKSQTLRDIHKRLTAGPAARTVLIGEVRTRKPSTFDDLFEGLRVVPDPSNVGYHLVRGVASNLLGGDELRLDLTAFRSQYEQAEGLDFMLGNLSRFRVTYLDAESRLSVSKATDAFNPHVEAPRHLLHAVFADRSKESALREVFVSTFGEHVRLGYSGMTRLAFRVARQFEDVPADPREAYPIMSQYSLLDEQGDGYRSFVAVVLTILLSEKRVVLLDEPEAFLHPAQARELGMWLGRHAAAVPGQVLISTHNASFLSGIVTASADVEVFRLNRRGDTTHFQRMSREATTNLARSPILSSQRVLEAIFFVGVIVCEADSDRVVYQSVADNMEESSDVLFLHAHNKQTLHQVVQLLRAAGVPTVAIADIDLMIEESEFTRLLSALSPTADLAEANLLRHDIAIAAGEESEDKVLQHLMIVVEEFLEQLRGNEHTLAGARGALNRLRRTAGGWAALKRDGLGALATAAAEKASHLLELCKAIGLFLVPVGELESWMALGTTRKNEWVVKALHEIHAGRASAGLRDFVSEALRNVRGRT